MTTLDPTAHSQPSPELSPMQRALKLEFVPRMLASVLSRYIFVALFVYLVILPISGIYTPSSNAMLEGGNYTNVTGALGACIASAVGLQIHREQKKRHLEQRMHEAFVRRVLGADESIDPTAGG